jgi:hypothetical protein
VTEERHLLKQVLDPARKENIFEPFGKGICHCLSGKLSPWTLALLGLKQLSKSYGLHGSSDSQAKELNVVTQICRRKPDEDKCRAMNHDSDLLKHPEEVTSNEELRGGQILLL